MKIILDKLYEKQDLKYKDFTSSLIPNISKKRFIGVRTPDIRKIAKDIYNSDYKDSFLNELPHKYQEENLLHGSLISLEKDIDVIISRLNDFLPFVDNWAVCDMISPKSVKKDLNKYVKQIKYWIKSKNIYTVRYAVVTLLQFYLDDAFKEEYNHMVSKIKSNEYYVNMAIAWYFSFALIKQYNSTISILQNKELDKWIHNKTIQKAIESYRIDSSVKEYLKSLRVS